LARAAAAEAVDVRARRLPGLRLAGQPHWRPSFRTHGPGELPVTW
ncbi:MAG TPA: cytochrome P450, partial [Micromonospora sp.]